MTPEQAHQQLTQDVNVFGTAMVKAGDASGMVSGSIHTTANTVRPALQIIKVSARRGLESDCLAVSRVDSLAFSTRSILGPEMSVRGSLRWVWILIAHASSSLRD